MDIHADFRLPTITTESNCKKGLKTAAVYELLIEGRGAGLKYLLEPILEITVEYDPDD